MAELRNSAIPHSKKTQKLTLSMSFVSLPNHGRGCSFYTIESVPVCNSKVGSTEKIKPHIRCGFKMGSEVFGLPSQETHLDSQEIHLDTAKIQSIFEFR